MLQVGAADGLARVLPEPRSRTSQFPGGKQNSLAPRIFPVREFNGGNRNSPTRGPSHLVITTRETRPAPRACRRCSEGCWQACASPARPAKAACFHRPCSQRPSAWRQPRLSAAESPAALLPSPRWVHGPCCACLTNAQSRPPVRAAVSRCLKGSSKLRPRG